MDILRGEQVASRTGALEAAMRLEGVRLPIDVEVGGRLLELATRLRHASRGRDLFRRALEIHTKLSVTDAENWRVWYGLGVARTGLADPSEQIAAVDMLGRAIDAYKKALELSDGNSMPAYWMSLAYQRMGGIHFRGDNYVEARNAYRKSRSLLKRFVEAGAPPRFTVEYAHVTTWYGDACWHSDEREKARKAYNEVRDLLGTLEERGAGWHEVSLTLGIAQKIMAEDAFHNCDIDDAIALLESATAAAKVSAGQSVRPGFVPMLTFGAHKGLAYALTLAEDYGSALQHVQEARAGFAVWENATEVMPYSRQTAERAFDEISSAIEELKGLDPDAHEARACALRRVGYAALAISDNHEAYAVFADALRLRAARAATGGRDAREWHMFAMSDLAAAAVKLGDREDMTRRVSDALSRAEGLATADPSDDEVVRQYANLMVTMGRVEAAFGTKESSDGWFSRAASSLAELKGEGRLDERGKRRLEWLRNVLEDRETWIVDAEDDHAYADSSGSSVSSRGEMFYRASLMIGSDGERELSVTVGRGGTGVRITGPVPGH